MKDADGFYQGLDECHDATLYVDLEVSEEELLEILEKKLGCIRKWWTMECGIIYIHTKISEFYVAGQRAYDFVTFKFLVEVYDESCEVELDAYLEQLARVMLALQDMGARVVAACDWEERLPGGGRLGVESLGPFDS